MDKNMPFALQLAAMRNQMCATHFLLTRQSSVCQQEGPNASSAQGVKLTGLPLPGAGTDEAKEPGGCCGSMLLAGARVCAMP